ncbi:granulocyte-macrophage colony-stimulating factor receptor subunit alpha isoform X1 [Saccopteryx leptura]|uniref:granulocyte-macrophage colony-stimulating factor receptor subunit alpha isoform X1 n=1 Tax=Saccopteryx leptura TaxID=249018 RepID=UPI00339D0F0E
MAPLLRAVLVLVLLDPVLLLIREQQQDLSGLPTAETTPSLNMHYDLRTKNLTWNCRENITSLECRFISEETGPVRRKLQGGQCHCVFEKYRLHRGVEFTVTVNTSQGPVTEKLVFTNPGGENTAAQKFSCFVYDADFLNCSWERGRAAPADVQYSLYIRDIWLRQEWECPRYVQDAGTHVGCHLRGVSRLTSWLSFLVTGSSRERGVQFFDVVILLKTIERYNPPTNITVHCNESHCLISWLKPRTRLNPSNWEFQYELDIRRQGEALSDAPLFPRVEVSGLYGRGDHSWYIFPSPQPRPKHTVQIRAADSRLLQWGAWSRPVEFGSGEQEGSPVYMYVLVVLGTLICVLVFVCLFKRGRPPAEKPAVLGQRVSRNLSQPRKTPRERNSFDGGGGWSSGSPPRFLGTPIPQVKDKLTANHPADDQIIWEKFTPPAGKGNHEEVLTVEEVRNLKAGV